MLYLRSKFSDILFCTALVAGASACKTNSKSAAKEDTSTSSSAACPTDNKFQGNKMHPGDCIDINNPMVYFDSHRFGNGDQSLIVEQKLLPLNAANGTAGGWYYFSASGYDITGGVTEPTDASGTDMRNGTITPIFTFDKFDAKIATVWFQKDLNVVFHSSSAEGAQYKASNTTASDNAASLGFGKNNLVLTGTDQGQIKTIP